MTANAWINQGRYVNDMSIFLCGKWKKYVKHVITELFFLKCNVRSSDYSCALPDLFA